MTNVLARLISYIHHTCGCRQCCYVGNTAQQCKLGLLQDSDFAGDLEDTKSTSGGLLCIFGSRTFVPISWMCKKPSSKRKQKFKQVRGNLSSSKVSEKRMNSQCNAQNSHSHLELPNVDFVSSNVNSSHEGATLKICEDNEAVIKMIIKCRSPNLRHVSRTHRVALDWLFDRINLDPKIPIMYVDSKNQLADILTKGIFSRDEWNNLIHLFHISLFSSQSCWNNCIPGMILTFIRSCTSR